jgi:hypothetical protein
MLDEKEADLCQNCRKIFLVKDAIQKLKSKKGVRYKRTLSSIKETATEGCRRCHDLVEQYNWQFQGPFPEITPPPRKTCIGRAIEVISKKFWEPKHTFTFFGDLSSDENEAKEHPSGFSGKGPGNLHIRISCPLGESTAFSYRVYSKRGELRLRTEMDTILIE